MHAALNPFLLRIAVTPGYDAIRRVNGREVRIQIKGRASGKNAGPGQRLGRIKRDSSPCDIVLLVLLDNATLEPREMWEAPYSAVLKKLAEPGSKARNERGALSISCFKQIAKSILPSAAPPRATDSRISNQRHQT